MDRLSRFSLIAFSGVALAALVAGCGGRGAAPPTAGSQHSGRHAASLIAAPATGVYLGAQVNPSATPGQDDQFGDNNNQEIETEYLEQHIMNRSLALHHEYTDWNRLSNASTDPEFEGDISHGRVPVISLNCADDMPGHAPYNLVDIINGRADTDLATLHNALTSLRYSSPNNSVVYPVMIRYFWEFNDNISGGQNNNNGNCFVPKGTQQPPGSSPYAFAPDLPTQFIQAWIHVRQQLLGVGAPVPNITFIWNPDDWDDASPGDAVDPTNYYPGSAYVDWYGIDGYSKEVGGTPLTFDQVFGNFMAWLSNKSSSFGQKPIMIGETASCQIYSYPNDQASYLQGAQSVLEDPTNYPNYTNVHAFLYFDAPGGYQPGGINCYWSLDAGAPPPETSGQYEFAALGQDAYFKPMALPTP